MVVPIRKISFSHSEDPVVRRADWRFLLDNPDPKRSVVFEGGLLADAVSMISASAVVSTDDHNGYDYDLAVAVNPTEKTLAVKPPESGPHFKLEFSFFESLVSRRKSIFKFPGFVA